MLLLKVFVLGNITICKPYRISHKFVIFELKAAIWVNLVDKIVSCFFAQTSDFEPWIAEPFTNERKSTPKIIICPDSNLMFFSFIGKWLSHSQFKIWILSKKKGSQFSSTDSLKSFPLGKSCKKWATAKKSFDTLMCYSLSNGPRNQ